MQKKKDAARVARQEETLDQRQMRLEKQRNRSRSIAASETEEQRLVRLQKQRERSKSKRSNETEEGRRLRQLKDKERACEKRATETKDQRDKRIESNRESTQLSRRNETDGQRQRRHRKNKVRTQATRDNETTEEVLQRRTKNNQRTQAVRQNETTEEGLQRRSKMNQRIQAVRHNETVEQHEKRLQQQKYRSQANRARSKIDKRSSSGTYAYLRSLSIESVALKRFAARGKNVDSNANTNADVSFLSWPEPIPRNLKNSLLQQYVDQMSMSTLAETVCAICHVRVSTKKTKKLPVNEIPNLKLLEISQDLKDVIINSHPLNSKNASTFQDKNAYSFEAGLDLSSNKKINEVHGYTSLFSF